MNARIITLALTAACLVICVLAGAPRSFSQTTAAHSPKKAATHHRKHATKPPVEAQPVAALPPAPPRPNWPVNDTAEPARILWNGRDLSITAANSSLQQILHDVATATGLKVEGTSHIEGNKAEQRIFGSYGPAPVRVVLSQLLDGSGFNVLMVGDRGAGTPRELILTASLRKAAGATPVNPATSNAEEDQPEDEEPIEAPEIRSPVPFGQPPAGPGRTPQQILQDIQQRQLQMQQQQQQQQSPDPQPQPVPDQQPPPDPNQPQ